MLPVVEIFTSIQGEGMYMGVPSHFVRVSGCNLRCVFKDSVCDTPYASFKPEKMLYKDMQALVEAFKKQQEQFPKVKHLVVTGGEPLMYKKDLEDFLASVWDDDMVITIETNGTRAPLNPLGKFRVNLYSISPKLSTSVGKPGKYGDITVTEDEVKRHDEQRINVENLVKYITASTNYQLKFVYSGPECLEEIKDIYRRMAEVIEHEEEFVRQFYMKNHPNKNTMLMPEGVTPQQMDKHAEEIVKICNENGWRYSDRLQCRIWNFAKRGV